MSLNLESTFINKQRKSSERLSFGLASQGRLLFEVSLKRIHPLGCIDFGVAVIRLIAFLSDL